MNTPSLYELFVKNPNICIDSRKATVDSLFFALKGENFDGNGFAQKALEKCSYAIVDDPSVVKDDRFILVEDVLLKLQQLAAYHRKRLGLPILAITGSNGKTTTKELIARVLSKKYKVSYTQGNFNNHIGVPLTLLKMTQDHEFGVVEMGANHIGEIALLCKITAPDFGIITNVGKAHLEGFGSFDGVKKAKGELYNYLYENDGTAFINYDNEHLEDMKPPHSIIYYGTGGFTHCQGKIERNGIFLKFRWVSSNDNLPEEIDWLKDSKLVSTKLIGDYNFENALAAACIGDNFNIESSEIKDAIESYVPENNRSQLVETKSNAVVVDSYNANPSSMKASIDNFSSTVCGKKMLILGDMLELGNAEIREHGAILGLLSELKIDKVILVGKIFFNYSDDTDYSFFYHVKDLIAYLEKENLEGYTILIKGSRGMQLERVLEYL